MSNRIAILVLCLPLLGLGIIPISGRRDVGGGTCGAFAETDWDNLTGWTQDNGNDFSADSTNDELDYSGGGDNVAWIQNDTTTTGSNQCALWQYKTVSATNDYVGILLRAQGGTGNSYIIGPDWGDGDVWWCKGVLTAGGYMWNWCDQGSQTGLPNAGDYISACVTGTGNDTVVTYWDHGGSDPGDCRTDWGTATFTFTANPGGDAVDSGSTVGMFFDNWGGSSASVTFDEFVGSDY